MVEIAGKMPIAPGPTSTTQAVGGAAIGNQQPNPAKNADPSKSATTNTIINAPFQIHLDHVRQRYLKLLVYGKHGAGKTELASTAVDVEGMRDVLVIDAEKGDATVEDSPRIKNPERLHNIPVTSFKQVAFVHDFLKAYCGARDRNDIAAMKKLFSQVTGIPVANITDEQLPRYRTVIIDSLTEVEVYCQYSILSIDSQKIITEDIDVAGWPEFRKNMEMVKLLVRAFRDLPMNVIFVCSESWTQDEQKKFHYSPALTGKLSAAVQGFVDIVGWLTVGQATAEQIEAPRRLYVQPISGGPKFDAKNRRSGFREAFFENPSMATIMEKTGML